VFYDGIGEYVKLDPNHRTCIVLRNISPETDISTDIWNIFGDYTDHIINMSFDLSLLYVWFDSTESTEKAFEYLDVLNNSKYQAFIKSDTFKSVSYFNPNEKREKRRQDDKNSNQPQKRGDRNNKNKKNMRPTHIAVGDDFPPLENVAKGGYDREFKKYTTANLINIVNKKVVARPDAEAPDCPALLKEQNLILEQSKKLPKSKEPFFLSNTKGGITRRRKGNNKKGKEKQGNQSKKDDSTPETRYADIVKQESSSSTVADNKEEDNSGTQTNVEKPKEE